MAGNQVTHLANEAYTRFQGASAEIEKVKEGIAKTKSGEATLVSIQKEPDRLASRIAREGMSLKDALERINGVPNFQDVLILKKLLRLSRSIGRITIKTKYGTSGFGTGFLIAPGILITNHHVFPDEETAQESYVQFDYELNDAGQPLPTHTFRLKPQNFFLTSTVDRIAEDPNSGLDFTMVAIEELSKEGKRITTIPHVRLDNTMGKILEGENCVVIQHPKGDYKKVVLKDIRMLTLADDFLVYESDTLPGSSGAMVVGLGTGELCAIHHSGVPRKNEQGQWLRKDGGVVQDDDGDETIDWIGNEGIRVSSLVRAVKKMKIPEHMHSLRRTILGKDFDDASAEDEEYNPAVFVTKNIIPPQETDIIMRDLPQSGNALVQEQAFRLLQVDESTHAGVVQYFEIELVDNMDMQEDWHANYRLFVKGAISSERVFPHSTDSFQKRYVYLTLNSDENAWVMAAHLESLPQVNAATPDLPMATDMQLQQSKKMNGKYESEISDVFNDGTAVWNESDFIKSWNDKRTILWNQQGDKEYNQEAMRGWNRGMVKIDEALKDNPSWLSEVTELKLVQLDTGYTDHSKVRGGFDLDQDEDFLDGDDARDENRAGVFMYPGHGTRTASIVIGKERTDMTKSVNGNLGILSHPQLKDFKVIPYRISQSVILINRAKNVADAVVHALNNNTDVLFMCMGSYPTPMMYAVAREVYERGVIWVCAAGNQVKTVIAPALYPGTIAVSAINPAYLPWRGSSYGSEVDVSAPGEDVYVPFYDKDLKEIMVYGDGTSYAAPHVASAAILWRAKNKVALIKKYNQPWQIVEAFRYCLRKSASRRDNYGSEIPWIEGYGKGILDVAALLKEPLPEASKLTNAYAHMPNRIENDLGFRETAYFLWQTLVKRFVTSTESTSPEMGLTERARICISALTSSNAASVFESYNVQGKVDAEKILHHYFESYMKKLHR